MSRPALTQTQQPQIPVPDTIGQHEVIVEMIDDRRDEFGRTRFFLFFHDPKTLAEGGPPRHVRGQCYHADLEKVLRDLRGRRPDDTASTIDGTQMTLTVNNRAPSQTGNETGSFLPVTKAAELAYGPGPVERKRRLVLQTCLDATMGRVGGAEPGFCKWMPYEQALQLWQATWSLLEALGTEVV